nr:hypothetical protein [Tanacetum cinerariifolium]
LHVAVVDASFTLAFLYSLYARIGEITSITASTNVQDHEGDSTHT